MDRCRFSSFGKPGQFSFFPKNTLRHKCSIKFIDQTCVIVRIPVMWLLNNSSILYTHNITGIPGGKFLHLIIGVHSDGMAVVKGLTIPFLWCYLMNALRECRTRDKCWCSNMNRYVCSSKVKAQINGDLNYGHYLKAMRRNVSTQMSSYHQPLTGLRLK